MIRKPSSGIPSAILDTTLTVTVVTAAESVTDLITGRRKPSVSAGVTVITSPTLCACITVGSRPLLCACVTVTTHPLVLTLEFCFLPVIQDLVTRLPVLYFCLVQETTLACRRSVNHYHTRALKIAKMPAVLNRFISNRGHGRVFKSRWPLLSILEVYKSRKTFQT